MLRIEEVIQDIKNQFEKFPSDGKIKIIISDENEESVKARAGLPEFWYHTIVDSEQQAKDLHSYFNRWVANLRYSVDDYRGKGLNFYAYAFNFKTKSQKKFDFWAYTALAILVLLALYSMFSK